MSQEEKLIDDLTALAEKSIDRLRTTIISLSGGALGTTIIFLKEITGLTQPQPFNSIRIAWLLWMVSIVTCLLSYFAEFQGAVHERRSITRGTRVSYAGFWYRMMFYLYLVGGVTFIFGIFVVASVVLSSE